MGFGGGVKKQWSVLVLLVLLLVLLVLVGVWLFKGKDAPVKGAHIHTHVHSHPVPGKQGRKEGGGQIEHKPRCMPAVLGVALHPATEHSVGAQSTASRQASKQ